MMTLRVAMYMGLVTKLMTNLCCFQAIVKGLCKFKKVGMTKAWEYFRQGIKLSKVERKEIQDSLLGRIIHTT